MDTVKATRLKAHDYAMEQAQRWRSIFLASQDSKLWFKRHSVEAIDFALTELETHCASLGMDPFAKLVFSAEARYFLADELYTMQQEIMHPRAA